MKKRDLLSRIRREADAQEIRFELLRNRGNHEVWQLDGMVIPIPRHREISEGTARAILKETETTLKRGWWR